MRLRRTIVLVGMMGSGKTAVGTELAARLEVPFRDSDAEIEAAAGRTIPEIFETWGEPEFREKERQVIARLLDDPSRVLSIGGGAFLDPATRDLIAQRAISVWLRADLDLLWSRVKGKGGRPLLKAPDPRARLAELLAARAPIYAEAALAVDAEAGLSVAGMAGKVLGALVATGAIAGGESQHA